MRVFGTACRGALGQQFVGQRLARDFVGPVGAGFEAGKRRFNIGEVLFDLVEIDGLAVAHIASIGR